MGAAATRRSEYAARFVLIRGDFIEKVHQRDAIIFLIKTDRSALPFLPSLTQIASLFRVCMCVRETERQTANKQERATAESFLPSMYVLLPISFGVFHASDCSSPPIKKKRWRIVCTLYNYRHAFCSSTRNGVAFDVW